MSSFLNVQLVELKGDARMKLSQDIEKVTIPGKKEAYRLYGGDGKDTVLRSKLVLFSFSLIVTWAHCIVWPGMKSFANSASP